MNIDRMFSVFKTASRGMALQRENVAIASENIANANTTRVNGRSGPYRPKILLATQNSEDFGSMLQQTKLNLKQDDPGHLSSASKNNLANMYDTMGPDFHVVEEDKFRYEYDPDHPDADENGMVKYPDIDMVQEMTRMVSANRLYEANLSVVQAQKEIVKRTLEI